MKRLALLIAIVSINLMLFSQNNIKIDTFYTNDVNYIKIEPFWLNGNDFILYVKNDNGHIYYKKRIFTEHFIYTLDNFSSNIFLNFKEQVDTMFLFSKLTYNESFSCNIIGGKFVRESYDFILVKKNDNLLQLIPIASKISLNLENIEHQNMILSKLIYDIIK